MLGGRNQIDLVICSKFVAFFLSVGRMRTWAEWPGWEDERGITANWADIDHAVAELDERSSVNFDDEYGREETARSYRLMGTSKSAR